LGDTEPQDADANKTKGKERSNIRHIGGFSNRDKPCEKSDPQAGQDGGQRRSMKSGMYRGQPWTEETISRHRKKYPDLPEHHNE
jgi:hypothetical protein